MATSALYEVSSPEYYLDTDIKLGSSSLNPEFRKHLESFYSKARTSEDRARCLELLTALDISSAVTRKGNACSNIRGHVSRPHYRRPFTACGNYGHKEVAFNPYMTSHKREFTGHIPCDTVGNRPRSSIGAFHYPTSRGEQRTTYADEYCEKSQPRTEPIRSGTATGTRRNNPHPLEAFMAWRIARGNEGRGKENAVDVAQLDKIMDEALRGKLQTTYQKDYLGLPLGCRPKQRTPILSCDSPPDPPPHTLDTTTRLAFQKPSKATPQLEVPLTRYASGIALTGSNQPSVGAVPGAASNIYLGMRGRTTYERHFTDPSSNGQVAPQDIRQVSRRYGAQALHNRLQQMAPNKEKEDLSDVLKCLDIHSSSILDHSVQAPRSPTTHNVRFQSGRHNPRAPQATAVCCSTHGDMVPRTPILSFETS